MSTRSSVHLLVRFVLLPRWLILPVDRARAAARRRLRRRHRPARRRRRARSTGPATVAAAAARSTGSASATWTSTCAGWTLPAGHDRGQRSCVGVGEARVRVPDGRVRDDRRADRRRRGRPARARRTTGVDVDVDQSRARAHGAARSCSSTPTSASGTCRSSASAGAGLRMKRGRADRTLIAAGLATIALGALLPARPRSGSSTCGSTTCCPAVLAAVGVVLLVGGARDANERRAPDAVAAAARPGARRTSAGVCAGLRRPARDRPAADPDRVRARRWPPAASGIPLYVVGWALIPAEGPERPVVARLLSRRDTWLVAAGMGCLTLAGGAAAAQLGPVVRRQDHLAGGDRGRRRRADLAPVAGRRPRGARAQRARGCRARRSTAPASAPRWWSAAR